MTPTNALANMVERSGKSKRAISLDLKRSENFIYETIRKGSAPQADTLAAIANACGYSLALIPQNEQLPDSAIVIDSN